MKLKIPFISFFTSKVSVKGINKIEKIKKEPN